MKSAFHILLIISFLLQSMAALACSFALGYESMNRAAVSWIVESEGDSPPPPAASVRELRRGYDDGNPGSCSDAGVLKVDLNGPAAANIAGYSVSSTGDFPANTLPDDYIVPIARSGHQTFQFEWLDWSLENISGEIEIRQITKQGRVSQPFVLQLSRHENYEDP